MKSFTAYLAVSSVPFCTVRAPAIPQAVEAVKALYSIKPSKFYVLEDIYGSIHRTTSEVACRRPSVQ